MRRTEQVQGLRLMRCEEIYERSTRRELSQVEAAAISRCFTVPGGWPPMTRTERPGRKQKCRPLNPLGGQACG